MLAKKRESKEKQLNTRNKREAVSEHRRGNFILYNEFGLKLRGKSEGRSSRRILGLAVHRTEEEEHLEPRRRSP